MLSNSLFVSNSVRTLKKAKGVKREPLAQAFNITILHLKNCGFSLFCCFFFFSKSTFFLHDCRKVPIGICSEKSNEIDRKNKYKHYGH